jgi:magnesium transporter
MPRIRLYRDGRFTDETVTLAEVSDRIAEPDTVVWIDVDDHTSDDLHTIAGELSLHPLAIEDALERAQRPKLDRYNNHIFITAYHVDPREDGSALAVSQVSAFITERAVVTVHDAGLDGLDDVAARLHEHDDLGGGVGPVVWALLDVLVDSQTDASESMFEDVETVEDAVFADNPDTRAVQRDAFALRKEGLRLRRVAVPMREVLTTLLRDEGEFVGPALDPYLRDVYDHVLRVTESLDTLRTLIDTVLDANATNTGNRMNLVMKKVTSWAGIIAVPTLVTGFYGMNVNFPMDGTVAGFWVASSIAAGSAVGLYALFRRNDWL